MNSFYFKKYSPIYSSKIILFLFSLIILFYIIKTEIIECSKDQPILISGQCKLEYCTKKQFELKQCIVNNTIVKTQWINNLIIFGDNSYRYLSYATFSNDDIVIESSCYPFQQKRMFYGLKSDGRPYFINKTNNKETPFYSKIMAGENNKMTESTSAIIKMIDNENNEKEYFLSLSKWNGHAELFDFEKDESYAKAMTDFTVLTNIKSIRHIFFPLISENKYFFGFASYHNGENRTYLQKHSFNKLNQFETTNSYTYETTNEYGAYGFETSCYQTSSRLIYCFSLDKVDNELYYYINKYESDFSDRIYQRLKSTVNDEYTFYKCIHLKNEIGVFAYYYNNEGNLHPVILFRQFNINEQKFEYYLPSEYSASGIMISKYLFINNILLNDIIKIREDKIAFLSTLTNKETLYITILNLYGDRKIKIRYYSVKLYAFYHYKILLDLKLIKYKSILGIGMSFCQNIICSNDYDEHYSGLILISYPNCTDYDFFLDKYISDNNINMTDIEIDLKNQINIDNNIFGCIFSIMVVNKISNCDNYKLYSSKYANKEIIDNTNLEEDEKIKIIYTGSQNLYTTVDCSIQYYFIVKEPELDIYNNYTEDHEGENEGDFFVREEYRIFILN